MFPMMDLHHAVADGRPVEAAHAATAGLAAGLTIAELIEVVGFGARYAAPARLAAVAEALEPVFANESGR